MIYLQLFFVYLQIGAFAFGGGYAAMPLIQSLVVEGKGWLSMAEFADLTTIAEMTPGPIAVNSANVCRTEDGWFARCNCLHAWLYFTVIDHCFDSSVLYTKFSNLDIVKKVLGRCAPAVVAMIASGMGILLMGLFGTSVFAKNSIGSLRLIELCVFIACFILLEM